MRYKDNERYLARVQSSIDAEKRMGQERKAARDARREAERSRAEAAHYRAQERSIKRITTNERAAEFWIATVGVGVRGLIDTMKYGTAPVAIPAAVLKIRAYNVKTKTTEEVDVLDFIRRHSVTGFPALAPNDGQIRYNDIVFPSTIYYFLKYHWEGCPAT
tara:strand:+ start:511 stop:993 length:483 start_codon:yes stop_codon:yes gene_type:complete